MSGPRGGGCSRESAQRIVDLLRERGGGALGWLLGQMRPDPKPEPVVTNAPRPRRASKVTPEIEAFVRSLTGMKVAGGHSKPN